MNTITYLLLVSSIQLSQVTNTAFAETIRPENLMPVLNEEQKIKDKVLLYFWASWCPDCREKLAGPLRELAKKNTHVSVITVNTDRNIEKGKEYAQESGLPLPVYRDEDKVFIKHLRLFAVPAWAVLEKRGEWKVVGASTGSDLQKIQNLLGDAK